MKNYVNTFEMVFENTDILSNPFMDYTKAELQAGYELQEKVYKSAAPGSAPRRQAFSFIAHIEVAFDAYAKAIKQFDVYVDEDTTLRDVLEDSYEIAHGQPRTVEEMRRLAGLPAIVSASSSVVETTVEKTKDISVKAGNALIDGIFHATSWLNKKTDPAKRK